jgi:4-hydroxythreonine-4-phosphate dehydrogenase
MNDRPPARIAITLGDPRGIGPEVAAAAVRSSSGDAGATLLFVGPTGTAADATDLPLDAIGYWRAGGDAARAGRLAALAIERATHLALTGAVDAIVTAPIDKSALHAAGYAWPGHTEMLAALSEVEDVVMLMSAEKTTFGGPLRVVLATTHLPLRDVPFTLTSATLVTQTRIAAEGLTGGWGMERPRVALCAFNPHASDGGIFGDEEARIYGPALETLAGLDLDVRGPIPADTVFVRAMKGEFDVVIAPYHDVGMAAFKTAAFGHGVNITLGLPFVRTSPDHGTALDIAGRDIADPSSMIEAIAIAAKLSARRRAVATAS